MLFLPFTRSAPSRYGAAILLPLVALGARAALAPLLHEQSPLMLCVFAGASAAWFGGFGPGLLAFALGGIGGVYFFIDPRYTLAISDSADVVRIFQFCVVAFLISWMGGALNRTVRETRERSERLAATNLAMEATQRQLEFQAGLLRDLVGSAAPETLVETLSQKVLAFIDADLFINYLRGADGRLRLNASGGISPEEVATIMWLEPGRTVCGCVAQNGERLVVEGADMQRDPRAELVRGYGALAYACYPLRAGGEVLGTLSFGSRKRDHFTPAQHSVMQGVVDCVALALERAKKVQDLRSSEERYRAFVGTSLEAIWRIEFDQPIDTSLPVDEQVALYFERAYYAEVNEALAKLYGFASAAEVPGLRARDVEPPHHIETQENVREFIAGGYRRAGEVSHEQDRHGARRNFLNNYVGFVENGRLMRIWGSSLDVTEHRRAEEALRQSEAVLKTFYESSPACMGMVEVTANDVFHIYDNPATCARLGVAPGHTAGRFSSELGVSAQSLAAWLERYAEVGRRGEPITFEVGSPAGAPTAWFSATVAPVPVAASGRPRYCYISLDVTKRREFEQRLEEAKERAEAASRAKDDFLATLSHELRNPLNPVLLTASAELANPALDEEQRELWEIVHRNVSLQARLVDDLLDLTRIARGRLSFQAEDVNLHTVLRDALSTIQPDSDGKAQRLEVALEARSARLTGDAARLQQVFWNVLRNAVKFTPRGGKIDVRSVNPGADGTIRIAVADTGMGLSEAEQERIFEAFVQGEHARGRNAHAYGGLGLGLAISREIIQSHRGRIWAESAGRDQGAIFYVELPVTAGA